MTKAKEVRTKRLEKKNQELEKELTKEVEKIFDWILDLMNDYTDRNLFETLELTFWKDNFKIMATHEETYDINGIVVLHHGLEKICTRLCECFNREEGYVTNLNLNDKSWDVPCITLEINIED